MNIPTATSQEVVLKAIPPIHVAAILGTVASVEWINETFGRLYGTLEDYVTRHGTMTGPYIALYLDSGTGPQMRDMHVELAIPYAGSVEPDAEVRVYDLPGVEQMACLTHKGVYAEIGHVYDVLFGWIQAHGYHVAGPMRDVYLHAGKGDSPDFVTEVQCPVAP